MSELTREKIEEQRDWRQRMHMRAFNGVRDAWLDRVCDMALKRKEQAEQAEARIRELEAGLRRMLHDPECDYQEIAWDLLAATPPPDSEPAEGEGGGETCPACPLEVRNLYACASNMFRRWDRRDVDGMEPVERKMESLRRAVRLFKPYIDQHFTDRDHYERSRRTREEYLADADHILSEHGRHKTYNEQGEHNAPPQHRDALAAYQRMIDGKNECPDGVDLDECFWEEDCIIRRALSADVSEAVRELADKLRAHGIVEGVTPERHKGWIEGQHDAADELDRALSNPTGEVVVTTNERGDAVAVTRQNEEGEILSVIWERDGEPAVPEAVWNFRTDLIKIAAELCSIKPPFSGSEMKPNEARMHVERMDRRLGEMARRVRNVADRVLAQSEQGDA